MNVAIILENLIDFPKDLLFILRQAINIFLVGGIT
jgi:hypothetical protein